LKNLFATAALALITGCSGLPAFWNPDQPSQHHPGGTSFQASLTPKEPKLGESLTVHYSDFPDGDYELWLMKYPEDNTNPRSNIGGLQIKGGKGVATVELKPEIGIEQFGMPFTLSAGETVHVVLMQPGKLSFGAPFTIR
jgi:hypothetical protein